MKSVLQSYDRQDSNVKAAIVGGCFVAVAALIGAAVTLIVNHPTDSRLEIVNVAVENDNIVFSVRNTGDRSAFLAKATVRVNAIWAVHRPLWPDPAYPVPISKTYDIVLPILGATTPYEREQTLAQGIDPDGLDRFSLAVGLEGTICDFELVCILQLEILLAFDGRREEIGTGPILFFARQYESYFGSSMEELPFLSETIERDSREEGSSRQDYIEGTVAANHEAIRRIQNYGGVMSDQTRTLLATLECVTDMYGGLSSDALGWFGPGISVYFDDLRDWPPTCEGLAAAARYR